MKFVLLCYVDGGANVIGQGYSLQASWSCNAPTMCIRQFKQNKPHLMLHKDLTSFHSTENISIRGEWDTFLMWKMMYYAVRIEWSNFQAAPKEVKPIPSPN